MCAENTRSATRPAVFGARRLKVLVGMKKKRKKRLAEAILDNAMRKDVASTKQTRGRLHKELG
jgi:hypothetical protein